MLPSSQHPARHIRPADYKGVGRCDEAIINRYKYFMNTASSSLKPAPASALRVQFVDQPLLFVGEVGAFEYLLQDARLLCDVGIDVHLGITR